MRATGTTSDSSRTTDGRRDGRRQRGTTSSRRAPDFGGIRRGGTRGVPRRRQFPDDGRGAGEGGRGERRGRVGSRENRRGRADEGRRSRTPSLPRARCGSPRSADEERGRARGTSPRSAGPTTNGGSDRRPTAPRARSTRRRPVELELQHGPGGGVHPEPDGGMVVPRKHARGDVAALDCGIRGRYRRRRRQIIIGGRDGFGPAQAGAVPCNRGQTSEEDGVVSGGNDDGTLT